MNSVKELTKEDLQNRHFLTVGRLKEFLNENKLPDDAVVVIQRVEDIYYDNHHWGVYLKNGRSSKNAEQWNKDIESGKYLNKDQFSKIKEENLVPYTEEQIKELMEQYHPAWCCVNYEDDTDVLFIDLHY